MGLTDFYSALFLIVGGLLGLFLLRLTSHYGSLGKFPEFSERIEALRARFEARKRWSWIMVFFGALWLLQLLLENHSLWKNFS
jgi:hypothetical protein